jgi:hypothetical protein
VRVETELPRTPDTYGQTKANGTIINFASLNRYYIWINLGKEIVSPDYTMPRQLPGPDSIRLLSSFVPAASRALPDRLS